MRELVAGALAGLALCLVLYLGQPTSRSHHVHGTGCEGWDPDAVLIADEEDQLPICDEIVRH